MFIPVTKEEINRLGWKRPDIIIVSGDSYIDSPFCGTAVIARVLDDAGYKVAVIAQPDTDSPDDITRLGEPALFWGVTAGCIDSMVANYTALKKWRKKDDYTPGGINNKRPDRAVIAYTNLIRRYFKNTAPIVLGGIEASLRRIAHYDFWSNKVRRSVLFDAKADYILYGMAEKSVANFADSLKNGTPAEKIRGICYIAKKMPDNAVILPSYELVRDDKNAFTQMFHTFYKNCDPLTAEQLAQPHGDRVLVQNPPELYLTSKELDSVHALPFTNSQHPYYEQKGKVRALETIRFSIATHRGCYGECSFCAIAVHQGRTVRWRSIKSVTAEAAKFAENPDFRGIITDAGGPTANMYGFECSKKLKSGACNDKRCMYPEICPSLHPDHGIQIKLLRELRSIKGVKKVFAASGIRYDMIYADKKNGIPYLREITAHHVSGQLKIAPEHSVPKVLEKMGKPGTETLLKFRNDFIKFTRETGKKQFLTYYIIAAHPGCTLEDMRELRRFAIKNLKLLPEQVQIFTPTPSTYATLMYWTEKDPFTGKQCFVEKNPAGKQKQKDILFRLK